MDFSETWRLVPDADEIGETDYKGSLSCGRQDNEIMSIPDAAQQHRSVTIYPTRVIRVLPGTFKSIFFVNFAAHWNYYYARQIGSNKSKI